MNRTRLGPLRRPRFRGIRTPVATPGQSARRLALLGLLSVALLVPLWYLTTRTEVGQRLADQILYGRVLAAPELLGAARDALATVSLAMAVIAALGLGILAFLRGGLGLLVAVTATIVGANVTAQLLKDYLERPNLLGTAAYAVGNSFPSGHVALVGSLALAAVLVLPRAVRTPTAVFAAAGDGDRRHQHHRRRLAPPGRRRGCDADRPRLGLDPHRDPGGRPGLDAAADLAPRPGGRRDRSCDDARHGCRAGRWTGLAVVLVGPGPIGDWLSVGPAPARTFVAAMTISAGSALLVVAAYVWALRGVALELPPPLP